VRTEQGKLHMFVAIDRTSKFAFVELHEKATTAVSREFLLRLIAAVPYKIHTVLTDNGIQFTTPGAGGSAVPLIKEPIRAHMMEFGIIVAKGAQNVDRLKQQLDQLPEVARMPVNLLFDQLDETNKRIEQLTDEIEETYAKRDKPASGHDPRCGDAVGNDHRSDDTRCRQFRLRERLCRLARPHAQAALTGCKQKVGRISKMGNRYIRRLLYLGAMAQIMLRCRLNREPGSIEHADAEEKESRCDRFGASHGKNDLRRPQGRITLRAAGSLIGSRNGQGKVR